MHLQTLSALVLLAATAAAHPHGQHEKVAAVAAQPLYRRSLAHCDAQLNEPEMLKRLVARREAEVERLRRERGLLEIQEGGVRRVRRDYRTVLETNHRVDGKGITPNSSAAQLFGDSGACILAPEVTEGPLCE